MIRRLSDSGDAVDDLVGMLLADERTPDGFRPWVMINMVSSIDGGTAHEGGATGLTDHDDQAMFAAFRSVADVVLVGASTVRVEDYGPVRLDAASRARRLSRGRPELPRLAIVSARLDLDPNARVFSDDEHPPVVFTCTAAPAERRRGLSRVSEVVGAGEIKADLGLALRWLGERGARTVLCEGGPTVNGQLVGAGLVDEMNLTVAPMMLSGSSARAAHGPEPHVPPGFRLDRLAVGERMLFARYVRADEA